MEDKFKDLLEDEELAALRLEALASKKRKLENAENSSDSVSALPINSIVTSSTSESVSNAIPFVQSDRNAYNNYTWRKQNQLSRRRGGAFPKSNQRSNLIIISPVSLNDDKDSQDKIPALILPQHKWCNSGNEDSMSPKTLRRTGPTRFNRHGSDSDSSDSDYENSENDSGSNETVLQDEPPEHYSCLSPKDDGITENVEKQRRLSFQNLENEIQSDTFEKNETTSVYNCLKNSSSSLDYTKNKSDNFVPVQNLTDNRHDWNNSLNSEYSSYKKYNSGHTYSTKPVDSTDGFVEEQSSCVVSNGESQINETSGLISQSSDTSVWQHSGVKANNLYYSRDISKIHESTRNHGLNDRKSRDYSDNRQSFQLSSEIQGPESSVWKHGERVRMSNSYFSRDSTCKTLPRNYCDDNVNSKEKMLSGNDLRFELKKRMQEMQPKPVDHENCELLGNTTSDQSSIRDRNKHRYIYEEDRIGDISHSDTYGSRQELNLLRNRQERSFSKERDEHSMNLNRRRHHRSLSRDRSKQENSCVRDRSRSEYNFSSDRGRYDRSSSLDRNKCTFGSSRGRTRFERSSSRGRFERSSSRGRFERSSSRGRFERSSSRGRFERSSSRGRFERSSSRGRIERSSSRGRIERSSSRGRTERSSSRGRTERSSSRGRTERSSSRGRSKRSSSRGRHRHGRECNSSKSKITYESVEDSSKLEQNLNQERNKHEYRSSQERDKHDHIVGRRGSHQEQTIMDDKSKHTRGRSRYEHRYSPSRKEYTRSSSRERGKSGYWSSRNHSRSDRSSSHESRDEHSSSSDSQHERSLSQDRSRHDYTSSQERSRHKRSRSQDQNKHKHSQSQDRSRHRKSPNLERNRHERSQSQDRPEHTGSQDRSRQERSTSHDKKKHDYSSKKGGSGDDSSEIKSRHELNSDGTKNSYKNSSSKGKSKFGVMSGEEKDKIESASGQENVECTRNLQSKRFDSTRNSERAKDDKRTETANTKEQFVTGDRNRQIRSRSKEKFKGRKKVPLKSSRVTNSEYDNKYSRSRSSSTSRSSSSSSSGSHHLRPKIRSVPSVIKSFQPKNLDIDKKETFCEVKFIGKNNSTSQCDDSFASSRKDSIDYKLSNVKCGRIDGDSKASDNSKRVPVHMRLGALPRKRLIQMPKDVEAAFVNSSSSSDGENVNTKCKRQNIRIVTDVYGSKSSGLDSDTKHSGKEKPPKRSPDLYQEKSKRMKTHR